MYADTPSYACSVWNTAVLATTITKRGATRAGLFYAAPFTSVPKQILEGELRLGHDETLHQVWVNLNGVAPQIGEHLENPRGVRR